MSQEFHLLGGGGESARKIASPNVIANAYVEGKSIKLHNPKVIYRIILILCNFGCGL